VEGRRRESMEEGRRDERNAGGMKGRKERRKEGRKDGGTWLYLYYGTIPAFTSRDEETRIKFLLASLWIFSRNRDLPIKKELC